MRTATSTLELVRPTSLEEALDLLAGAGPEDRLRPIAGCTDVYVELNFGIAPRQRHLDLWPLRRELGAIEKRGEVLSIGALATYSQQLRSPLVRARLPILAEAARQIGGVQIQNRGTLGGNIANGSPAGDTLPVLAVAEAIVVLRSASGERRVPITGFYTGYRASVMRRDELIVAVEIPPVPGVQWFRKVGTRAASAISKVVIAAVRAADRPRIAIGSVAPTVLRVRRTEEALGRGEPLERVRQVLDGEIAPIDDIRSTAAYRRAVCANLLERFWHDTASSDE